MDRTEAKSQSVRKHHRAWALYLATITGIPIYLHFTFLLLLAFVFIGDMQGHQYLGGFIFLVCIFTSVALHELGHATMARRFGIGTEDIVLYPIGGVARLRSMGEGLQELWIALAGPFVNVVIASILYTVLELTGWMVTLEMAFTEPGHLVQRVMVVNIVLVIFNMIPAFPMDGGRVLRAILTQTMSKARATEVAAKIGQALAIMFMFWGLLGGGNIFLMIIGLFVYLAAGQEAASTRNEALMTGKKVRDAMITHFEVLCHGDTLGKAADMLLATSQQDFPVLGGPDVIGVLSRKALLQGLAEHGRDHYVAEVTAREYPRVNPAEDLHHVLEQMREYEGLPALVFDEDRLVGYIDNDNLMEYLMIAQTRPEPEAKP